MEDCPRGWYILVRVFGGMISLDGEMAGMSKPNAYAPLVSLLENQAGLCQ